MSADVSIAVRAQEENWLPILELAVQEVFEIMLGCHLEPAAGSERKVASEVTAMVGLAGALCGMLTMGCAVRSANLIAARMLGTDVASSGDHVCDALGEIANMIAGNFKNKLSGTADRCMLSVPTVITGAEYNFHSLADGGSLETTLLFEGAPVRIEGHTDNVPIHNSQFSSNWELSTARATEIVRVLIVKDGFEPLHLSAAGYAEYHPIASTHSNEGRAMNRRVDVVILGHDLAAVRLAQAGAQTSAEASVTAKTAKPSPAAAFKPTALRTAGGSLQH